MGYDTMQSGKYWWSSVKLNAFVLRQKVGAGGSDHCNHRLESLTGLFTAVT
jgi:hypothetical protein